MCVGKPKQAVSTWNNFMLFLKHNGENDVGAITKLLPKTLEFMYKYVKRLRFYYYVAVTTIAIAIAITLRLRYDGGVTMDDDELLKLIVIRADRSKEKCVLEQSTVRISTKLRESLVCINMPLN